MGQHGKYTLEELAKANNRKSEFMICDLILESYVRGNKSKAKELFLELNLIAKDEFVEYFVDFYGYVPADTEEPEGNGKRNKNLDVAYEFFCQLM